MLDFAPAYNVIYRYLLLYLISNKHGPVPKARPKRTHPSSVKQYFYIHRRAYDICAVISRAIFRGGKVAGTWKLLALSLVPSTNAILHLIYIFYH